MGGAMKIWGTYRLINNKWEILETGEQMDAGMGESELGHEPIKSEWLANVRFGAYSGPKSDIARGPKWANKRLCARS
jgi:hypothetical protein